MMMTFATLGGGVLQESRGMPTAPGRQTHIYRWISKGNSHNSLQVTALNPGSEPLALELNKDEGEGFAIKVSGGNDYHRTIRVTGTLQLLPAAGLMEKSNGLNPAIMKAPRTHSEILTFGKRQLNGE
jgi:hypothetical protein